MTTLKGFATPIDATILGHPLGDHTWVASDQAGSCWNCLGGGPNYYCGPQRWHNGHYVPPEGHQICSGDCVVSDATCMGDPKQSSFMGVPSSAGIVYAVNGVCHQIANRVLYWAEPSATPRGIGFRRRRSAPMAQQSQPRHTTRCSSGPSSPQRPSGMRSASASTGSSEPHAANRPRSLRSQAPIYTPRTCERFTRLFERSRPHHDRIECGFTSRKFV